MGETNKKYLLEIMFTNVTVMLCPCITLITRKILPNMHGAWLGLVSGWAGELGRSRKGVPSTKEADVESASLAPARI